MRTLLMLLLIVLTSGCKPILKTVYGIKDPAVETDSSVKEYLVKKRVDTTNVLTFPTVFSFAMASEQNYLIFPDALFFNKEGYFVPYKSTAQTCNANVSKFIDDLKNFSSHPADQSRKLSELESYLQLKKTEPAADITVFITWTKYSGRLNKTKAFEWVRALEKAKKDGISLNYYLLNCDFQKKWNIPDDQLKSMMKL